MISRSYLPLLALALATGPLVSEEASRLLSSPERHQLRAELPGRLESSQARIQSVRQDLGLGEAHAFQVRASHQDEFGQTHARFAHFYQGVRVWGSEAITHMQRGGDFRKESLAIDKNLRIQTRPTLAANEALATVHQTLNPKGAYSVDPSAELVIYPITQKVLHRFRTKGKDVPNALEAEDVVIIHRLAYHVHAELENAQDPLQHRDFIVDAHTGKVIEQWSSLQKNEPAVGTAKTLYSGDVQLNTTKVDSRFELRDMTRPLLPHPVTGVVGNAIYDSASQTEEMGLDTGKLFSDEDNAWGDGANYIAGGDTFGANGQTAAADAAFGLQTVWDYFKNIHGQDGIDGKGTATHIRVHYGQREANAFWSPSCYCASFGDGSGSADDQVYVPMDVVGHEYGHGFNNMSANLEYRGEIGGLNEANSDITGTMVEFYARGNNFTSKTIPDQAEGANWLMGEQIGMAMRCMYKPSQDGNSPDAWSPEMDALDVHYTSGPMNRAFYFLSQGAETSGEKSASYLPNGMKGIGNTNAARIWHRAMSAYLVRLSRYKDARAACLLAAKDISAFENFNGQPVTQADAIAAVQNAFAGINVGWAASDEGRDQIAPVASAFQVVGDTGRVNFELQASDNTGITLVEFHVDGLPFASLDKPGEDGRWVLNFDSSIMRNGEHQVRVLIYDASGNIGYAPDATQPKTPVKFMITNPVEQILQDPGFEQGDWIWRRNAGSFLINSSKIAPELFHSGKNAVLIGGAGQKPVSNPDPFEPSPKAAILFQKFPMPNHGQNPKVSFWVNVLTAEAEDAPAKDALTAYFVSEDYNIIQTLGSVSNEGAVEGFQKVTFDVDPAIMGKNVYLYLEGQEDAYNPTFWVVDDFAVTFEDDAVATPTIKAFAPGQGRIGDEITLTGAKFTGATEVAFNGKPATFTFVSDSELKTVVPAGTTPGFITVTTPVGTGHSTVFEMLVPVISTINPDKAKVGEVVTVNGQYFQDLSELAFNGVKAAFTFVSDNQVTATIPEGAFSGYITMTTPSGTGFMAEPYHVIQPAPVLDGVTPLKAGQGSTITLTGNYFMGATSVDFNGKPSKVIKVLSNTQIQAQVPKTLALGETQVTVTTPDGVTAAASITVTLPVPVIREMTPETGYIGDFVSIKGSGFVSRATDVKFNGVKASGYYVSDETSLGAIIPAGATTGKVTITTSGGTGTSEKDFIILKSRIDGMTPANGPVGTEVTLTGKGLSDASAVYFNGVKGVITVKASAGDGTEMKVMVPTGATTGVVSLETSLGKIESAQVFTVLPSPMPVVTSFSPASGPAGTQVVLVGSGFTGASAVTFNGAPGKIIANGGTTLTVEVPAEATTGPISVLTAGGVANSSVFTVTLAAPAITLVNPTSAKMGEKVVISGAHLLGATAVAFNGVQAQFKVTNATQITTTVPVGATSGPITVTTPGGTANSSAFTVLPSPMPVIQSFTPESGKSVSWVVVTGSGFAGMSGVNFNGTKASFIYKNDSAFEALVPLEATTGFITVTTPGGTATSAKEFVVIVPAPAITKLSATSAKIGEAITLTGSNFKGVSAVTFNGVPAVYKVVSSRRIDAIVPIGATTGPITVTTATGSVQSEDFTVTPALEMVIHDYTPKEAAAGSVITVLGENFKQIRAVSLGGVHCGFRVVNENTLEITVSNRAVTGPIMVIGMTGAASSKANVVIVK